MFLVVEQCSDDSECWAVRSRHRTRQAAERAQAMRDEQLLRVWNSSQPTRVVGGTDRVGARIYLKE